MIEKVNYGDAKRWFPKTNHLTDTTEKIGDDMSNVCASDGHTRPYIGDFPPKDTYREGIYD